MKYAAEEVRKSANWLYQWERDWLYQWERKAGVRNVRAMLIAYAERIEADEGAVVVAHRFLGPDGTPVTEWDDGLPDNRKTFPDLCPPVASVQYAYDRPPAQAAQRDLRNSLLRGKAQNEEPRIRHSCNMGVGCEETGICYAEANGQPEQCGRPTAEPVAQGEPVAGIQVPREGLPRAAQFIPYPAWLRLPPGIHDLFAAPPAQPAGRVVEGWRAAVERLLAAYDESASPFEAAAAAEQVRQFLSATRTDLEGQ